MRKTVFLAIRSEREKFVYSFIAVFILAAFAMNFVSFFGILRGRIILTETIDIISPLFLMAFSLLAATAATLHIYRAKNMATAKLGKEKMGIAGAFLGLFTSACSICYPLILTFIGIPTALAILPFGGAELQALSIILLLASIYFAAKSIENAGVCKPKASS